MSPGFAIDTNVVIYAFSDDDRRLAAMRLLQTGPRISVQILNEFASVSSRKRGVGWTEIEESVDLIVGLSASVRPLDLGVHDQGRLIAQRYRLSVYDSLIISAALFDDCEILYSEDMHHGLVINGALTIVNPFLTGSE